MWTSTTVAKHTRSLKQWVLFELFVGDLTLESIITELLHEVEVKQTPILTLFGTLVVKVNGLKL